MLDSPKTFVDFFQSSDFTKTMKSGIREVAAEFFGNREVPCVRGGCLYVDQNKFASLVKEFNGRVVSLSGGNLREQEASSIGFTIGFAVSDFVLKKGLLKKE